MTFISRTLYRNRTLAPVKFDGNEHENGENEPYDDQNGFGGGFGMPEGGQPTQNIPNPPEFCDHSPIERRTPSAAAVLILALLLIIAMICIPLSVYTLTLSLDQNALYAFDAVFIAISILLAMYLSRSIKGTKGIMPIVIFFGILLFLSTSSMTPTMFLLAVFFIMTEGSFLLTVVEKKLVPILCMLPLIAFFISFAICGMNLLFAAMVLLPVPAAIVHSLCTHSAAKKKGITRVGIICALSFTIGLTLALIILAALYFTSGEISVNALVSSVDRMRGSLIEILSSFQLEAGNETVKLFNEEEATLLVNSAINILPGTIIAAVNIFSFFVQMTLTAVLHKTEYIKKPVRKMFEFKMSFMSGFSFAISLILMLVFSTQKESSIIGVVASNVVMIFEHGLALVGISSLLRAMARRRMGCGFFLLALAVLMVSMVFNYLILILAAIGAFFVLREFFRDISKSKQNTQ